MRDVSSIAEGPANGASGTTAFGHESCGFRYVGLASFNSGGAHADRGVPVGLYRVDTGKRQPFDPPVPP